MQAFKSIPRLFRPLGVVGICMLLASATAAQPVTSRVGSPSFAPKMDVGVLAFRDVCLASSPSFDKAWEFARQFGVKPANALGIGMTDDGSLSVQVQPGKECSITSENRPGADVHEQFASVVANATGFPKEQLLNTNALKTLFRGKPVIFHHDRKGGEAYVMLNVER